MKKNYLKKVMLLTLSSVMVASAVAGCGTAKTPTTDNTNKDPKSYSGTLNVWSFTDELKANKFIDSFNKTYPNINIKLTVTPMDNNAYSTKIASVMSSGSGAPDVYTAEVSMVNKFVNQPYYEDLSKAPYNAEDLVKGGAQYAVDLGRNQTDHSIRALTWQATPGGFFYRRSLAKTYFGTDDPDKISAMSSSMDSFMTMGKTVKEKSNGKVTLLAGYQELYNVAQGSRTQGWVVDNKLTIDQKTMDYIDQAKAVRDNGYDAKINQWTPQWASSMVNGTVFGYMLPTWGLPYVIATDAPKTSGDWALAKAPSPYYWGGTWIGMYSKSKQKDLGWQFVKFLTLNDDFLLEHAKTQNDFVTSNKVDNQLATTADGNNAFCGGQNIAKVWASILPSVTGKLVTAYDETINNKFQAGLDLYVNGKTSKDAFMKAFKTDVKTAYPDIETD